MSESRRRERNCFSRFDPDGRTQSPPRTRRRGRLPLGNEAPPEWGEQPRPETSRGRDDLMGEAGASISPPGLRGPPPQSQGPGLRPRPDKSAPSVPATGFHSCHRPKPSRPLFPSRISSNSTPNSICPSRNTTCRRRSGTLTGKCSVTSNTAAFTLPTFRIPTSCGGSALCADARSGAATKPSASIVFIIGV
jgi:hypothetical protein